MNEVVIFNCAESDVVSAYLHFETIGEGLGESFALEIDDALGLVSRFPESGARFGEGLRRVLVRRFPFGVFYTVESGQVVIQAVLDLRQSPEQILGRRNLQ